MQAKMDEGEVEVSDNGMLQNPGSSSNFLELMPGESFVDELLKNTRTCTHTHTCNPPGPDSAHMHTCFHTHTQVLTSEDDEHQSTKKHSASIPRRPLGNREAVRKYREKKKAHTAYLEEEVKKLHLVNQQLVKKLQGQAALEAEVVRLRSILIDLRGKIDSELGDFPSQKLCNSVTSFKEGDCEMQSTGRIGLRCQTDLPCFHPHPGSSSSHGGVGGNGKVVVPWDGNCDPAIIDCPSIRNGMPSAEGHPIDTVETLISSASQAE